MNIQRDSTTHTASTFDHFEQIVMCERIAIRPNHIFLPPISQPNPARCARDLTYTLNKLIRLPQDLPSCDMFPHRLHRFGWTYEYPSVRELTLPQDYH